MVITVNEEWLWIMAVEWFYLLLKPLLLALVDHVVFTCFQVSLHKFLIYMILHPFSFKEKCLLMKIYYIGIHTI